MAVEFDDGRTDTFLAYATPDVSTFHQEAPGRRVARKPYFQGQFGKFINLSNQVVQIYWDPGAGKKPSYIAEADPFETAGTATFPGHRFVVFAKKTPGKVLKRWTITATTSLYVYDPYESNEDLLTLEEKMKYRLQKDNLAFGKQYEKVTGREWLSLYPLRHRPLHPMWPADYFGQQHVVTTKETQFVQMPEASELGRIHHHQANNRRLEHYRTKEQELNLTLTVLSCSPRVYEIKDFLSQVEVDHILQLATGESLLQSSTKAGVSGESRLDDSTRTSRNTWVTRERSTIVDTIYKRSADLLRIDESYMRYRKGHELPEIRSKGSNAEQLQLVHYSVGQQYTPHHDFSVPLAVEGQPMRFATILFYLNEGMTGGETTFPRWQNADTGAQLKVTPEVGKAVLFYSLLPDGNMDERSQHASVPVTSGEKWITNLWVWDPVMRFV